MQVPLKKCNNPDCKRQTTDLSSYCCTPCAMSAQYGHEVEEHSQGCDIRHATRGDWVDPDAPPAELPESLIAQIERARRHPELRKPRPSRPSRPMRGWPDSQGRDDLWW